VAPEAPAKGHLRALPSTDVDKVVDNFVDDPLAAAEVSEVSFGKSPGADFGRRERDWPWGQRTAHRASGRRRVTVLHGGH
jgi:hypothetical protein